MSAVKADRPMLSGFCNPGNPEDSHRRCRSDFCVCDCHADPVGTVARAVQALEDARDALVEDADDPEGLQLALLLQAVREARVKLYGVEQDIEAATAKAMMGDQAEGPGLRVERYRAKDRKEWDHESWQHDARMKALRKHGALKAAAVVTADGEALPLNLHDLLREVQQVHSAGQPKTTALRALGLDAADYCTTSQGAWHVRVLRLAGEGDQT